MNDEITKRLIDHLENLNGLRILFNSYVRLAGSEGLTYMDMWELQPFLNSQLETRVKELDLIVGDILGEPSGYLDKDSDKEV